MGEFKLRMNKTIIILLLILFLFSFCVSVSAVTLEKDTRIIPGGSNTVYTLGNDLSIVSLRVENTTPYFNNNIFYIEPQGGTANVTIHSLNSMSFTVTATSDVVFNLGGFNAGKPYEVRVDNVKWKTFTANSNGEIQFEYDSWSSHLFSIFPELPSTVIPNFIGMTGLTIGLAIIFSVLLVSILIISLIPGSGMPSYGSDTVIEAFVITIIAAIFFVVVLGIIPGII